MTTLTQPFDDGAFNFLKIDPRETIADMVYRREEAERETDRTNLLLINVSPLEFGHSLFVPDVFAKWTQVFCSSRFCFDICLSWRPAYRASATGRTT